ncbi:circadian clock protein LdpA [Oxynema aestuarii]|uniref:circadian clock protein LdpA n=1 Tax=Oxynema aestuarii TaxID=2874213 RepID=UPI000F2B0CE9|nr:LdpA C-terminal domain-containing domain [Oxynema aestuarii]RMH72527.1 MAG: 4Fe-4S ferredoxin [Cyanobacteria bacterium J007]
MIHVNSPLKALSQGHWFKLICGASFGHLPAVRNLALAYTLVGADCIDVAADPAVIAAAKQGIEAALEVAAARGDRLGIGGNLRRPLLMASLNDGEDPHFRKAEFNPAICPSDCPRPCERICPARAIRFESSRSGVIDELCYGCGRCLPVCPIGQIVTRSYVVAPGTIAQLILDSGIDAIEIHTQVGRLEDFKRLWGAIAPKVNRLQVLAISCPDAEGSIDYLRSLYAAIAPLPCPLIWQTDGRPMSGDIGAGTTHAAVKFARKVLAADLPGYVQLAGGTNHHTVAKLQQEGLLRTTSGADKQAIAGIAYGSYARALLAPVLDQLEIADGTQTPEVMPLEQQPDLLREAVNLADSLVSPLKIPIQLQNTTNNYTPAIDATMTRKPSAPLES